eukprot:5341885-Lingulodinium_polyedra.AAC.1
MVEPLWHFPPMALRRPLLRRHRGLAIQALATFSGAQASRQCWSFPGWPESDFQDCERAQGFLPYAASSDHPFRGHRRGVRNGER